MGITFSYFCERDGHSRDPQQAAIAFGSFGLRALASGIFGSLAAAEPRAAAARFRRALMTILGPRRASLLAAPRETLKDLLDAESVS